MESVHYSILSQKNIPDFLMSIAYFVQRTILEHSVYDFNNPSLTHFDSKHYINVASHKDYGSTVRDVVKYLLPLELYESNNSLISATLNSFLFAIKTSFNVFIFVLVRATVPRYRYDQLMNLG